MRSVSARPEGVTGAAASGKRTATPEALATQRCIDPDRRNEIDRSAGRHAEDHLRPEEPPGQATFLLSVIVNGVAACLWSSGYAWGFAPSPSSCAVF
jgi:hypothetical protein